MPPVHPTLDNACYVNQSESAEARAPYQTSQKP